MPIKEEKMNIQEPGNGHIVFTGAGLASMKRVKYHILCGYTSLPTNEGIEMGMVRKGVIFIIVHFLPVQIYLYFRTSETITCCMKSKIKILVPKSRIRTRKNALAKTTDQRFPECFYTGKMATIWFLYALVLSELAHTLCILWWITAIIHALPWLLKANTTIMNYKHPPSL